MKHMFDCARMEKDEEPYMASKRQRLLGLGLLLFITATAGLFLIFAKPKTDAGRIVITLDGAVYAAIPLDEDTVFTIEDGKGGYNVIQVENGTVRVSEANCSNQVCVNTGTVSHTGEVIACLPHRLILSVSSGNEEVDAIAY